MALSQYSSIIKEDSKITKHIRSYKFYNSIIGQMLLPEALVNNLLIPYMVDTQITIKITGVSTYRQLLTDYDPALLGTIQGINNQMLNQTIYLFQAFMSPEKINWRLWKNKNEILGFIQTIGAQIKEMSSSNDRMIPNGNDILSLYDQLRSTFDLSQNTIILFNDFLNCLAYNQYMKKSQEFLLFIEHCVSVDKWDMKIYMQFPVYKQQTAGDRFTAFFKSNKDQAKERNFFITITGDGILKSDNHLLESRINFMIPFTNQLTIQCKQTVAKQITFIIQACAHEQLVINFFKEYSKAIDFTVALRMALEQSSYSDPNHRFGSYCPVRQNCASKLYNDGAQYYDDLYEELMSAKWQVCITGWMITPYFLLKRPNKIDAKQYRLDGVIQLLAERGVKVYIIVFMEPKMFVNNDSEHVQYYLQSLHDNIKVYRHPNDTIPSLWSHHEKMIIIDQQIGFMGGLDICYGRWDYSQHKLQDPGLLWDGADYNNYRLKDITKPRNYKQSNLNTNFQCRMPWHDIALQFRGDVVLDLLRHFVQYWYFVKSQLLTDPSKMMNFLKKRYEQAFYNPKTVTEKEEAQFYLIQIKKKQQAISFGQKLRYMINGREQRLPQLLIQSRPGRRVGNQRLQMCRSASQWSIGVRKGQHQSSIHQAYQVLIKQSKKFIYIENQFFMGLQNRIVECLAQRIQKAYRSNENFKVIVVMPLLPAFEGDIGNPASTVLRIQVYYQFQAILRGENSLFKRLHFIPAQKLNEYIYFFGLRQSEMVNGTAMTEIVYVHSKLMIVDDTRCIIGSANINDRSLLGTRDSELACIIEENNGSIFDLRCRIFAEHFGLTKQQTANICDNRVWYSVIQNSKRATIFYRDVFGCVPDDTATVAKQIDTLSSRSDINKFKQGRPTLKGHAVDFPLQFMKDEDLRFTIEQKQYFAPQKSFT